MNATKSLVLVAAGLVAGVVLIMSCSDDSPSPDADAAPCECPIAEPPITSARLVTKTNAATAGPASTASQSVACDEGGLLVTGGCGVPTPIAAPDLFLSQSYPTGNVWSCYWQNESATETYDVQVTIRCLMPPQ